jgi:putative restriction endonuclease
MLARTIELPLGRAEEAMTSVAAASPNNFIVGGGLFGHASIVPISLAWAAFGERNGASSLDEMRVRVAPYRRELVDLRADYSIGCRILEQPFFWPRDLWLPIAGRLSSLL